MSILLKKATFGRSVALLGKPFYEFLEPTCEVSKRRLYPLILPC